MTINSTQLWIHRNTLAIPEGPPNKSKVFLPNTRPSIKSSFDAFSISGVYATEIDLLTTKNGSPVIFNPFSPYSLGSDSAGQKRKIFQVDNLEIKSFIPDVSKEQIFLAKRYGDIEIPTDVDTSIPFLSEIDSPTGIEILDLDLIKLDLDYMEGNSEIRNQALRNITNWIKTNSLENNVIITGKPDTLEDMRRLLGNKTQMCLAVSRNNCIVDDQIKVCDEIGIQFASPNTVQVLENLEIIEHFRSRNVDLVPAEIREEGKDVELDAIRRLMSSQIPAIKTNFLTEALEIRQEVFGL